MTDGSDFDAEDLVNAILGREPVSTATATPDGAPSAPTSADRSQTVEGSPMGWLLLGALVLALSIAVGLALQASSDASPNPPRCGGLYSQCCDDWDDNWGDCPNERRDNDRRDNDRLDDCRNRGLFDSEERFADC